jgi:hypothetical protein
MNKFQIIAIKIKKIKECFKCLNDGKLEKYIKDNNITNNYNNSKDEKRKHLLITSFGLNQIYRTPANILTYCWLLSIDDIMTLIKYRIIKNNKILNRIVCECGMELSKQSYVTHKKCLFHKQNLFYMEIMNTDNRKILNGNDKYR